ncbi:DUF6168 family protein [Flavobacteriaceae bacterium]|nr:DUF6168 family protein [Flavobacteriaceae bacterium]
MNKQILLFFTVPVVAFFLHDWVLETSGIRFSAKWLEKSYFVNALMALGIYLIIYLLRNKFRDQLGFLFLFGSFIKFGVYFLFFQGNLGEGKLAFSLFFIPYAVCLIIEVLALRKILNQGD